MYNRHAIGKLGEDIASDYLEKKGYKIIERNFSCMQGEIDIIAQDKKEKVFVEVKTRTNLNYGYPIESVTEAKKNHIEKSSQYYIYKNHLNNEYIRIDAIEIFLYKKNKYKINHIKNIIL